MPNVMRLTLRGAAWWRIHEGDPATFPFTHRPGWALLNPALYPTLLSEGGHDKCGIFGGPREDAECALIVTNLLYLETPIADVEQATEEFFFDEVPTLLAHLRYVSRYAKFPMFLESGGITKVNPINWSGISLPAERERGAISRFNLNAAMTISKIAEFVSLQPQFVPPIYSTLLLDAIEAHAAADFKKSLLYCAIAAETVAVTKLEEAYGLILSQDLPAHGFHVVSLPGKKDSHELQDPVYEALKRTSHSKRMRSLMHEQPLYLLGKSLLRDDKALYDATLHLFERRNHIAHQGGGDIDQRGSSSSYKNVADAIHQVARLFEWYGESGPYPVLDQVVFLGGNSKSTETGA